MYKYYNLFLFWLIPRKKLKLASISKGRNHQKEPHAKGRRRSIRRRGDSEEQRELFSFLKIPFSLSPHIIINRFCCCCCGWLRITVVTPAYEHCNTPPHDVETSPLLLHKPSTLASKCTPPMCWWGALDERSAWKPAPCWWWWWWTFLLWQLPFLIKVKGWCWCTLHPAATIWGHSRSHGEEEEEEEEQQSKKEKEIAMYCSLLFFWAFSWPYWEMWMLMNVMMCKTKREQHKRERGKLWAVNLLRWLNHWIRYEGREGPVFIRG